MKNNSEQSCILKVRIDGRVFNLDYSIENITKILDMFRDEKVSPLIQPNLAMCILAHSAYFRDYPLDDVIELLKEHLTHRQDMLVNSFLSASGFKLFKLEEKVMKGGET
ncbi:TPA: hypothetical protein U0510_000531 [Streptococcus suis]|nr:hypothetical protein [Streptococcus suis]HEM2671306.1 hypothetical protein [Streptococcus suis]HEM5233655.1 hypothetical protein [Streptococcus suis]